MTATTRMTIGSALGMITSATTSVNSIFTATTKAIGMADTYVSDAAAKQQIRSKIEIADFKRKLVEEKSMEEAQRRKTIREFCTASTTNEQDFIEAKAHFDKILAE